MKDFNIFPISSNLVWRLVRGSGLKNPSWTWRFKAKRNSKSYPGYQGMNVAWGVEQSWSSTDPFLSPRLHMQQHGTTSWVTRVERSLSQYRERYSRANALSPGVKIDAERFADGTIMKAEANRTVRNALIRAWQKRWEVNSTGWSVFDYFPDIERRLSN